VKAAISQTTSIVALDVGEKRVGVAIARLDVKIPRPYGVIPADDNFWSELKQILDTKLARIIVVGLPRGLDGQETAQTLFVREFVKQNIPTSQGYIIKFQDEALTSKLAEEELGRKSVGYTRGEVDALAACYILSDYLEEMRLDNQS
jgi:putative holliday junction resolvase